MKFQLTLVLLLGLNASGSDVSPPPKVFVAPTPVAAATAPPSNPASSSAFAPSAAPAANSTTPASAAPAATPAPPPSAPPKLGASELEKLAMPMALYPDSLISVLLPASVYPLEIVKAARFVRDTNNIAKIDEQPWDSNVKAVARFPDLIAKMDADLDWTTQLGQAFLDQPKELMDTIQDLRGKAQKAGTLRTTEQQIVNVTNVVVLQTNITEVTQVTKEIVQIAPANPQVVYVPTYPPTVYYPPPAYVYNPYAPLVTFGVGMAWGAIIANNHCDWGHGGCYNDVNVDVDRNVNRNVNRNVDRNERPTQQGNRGAGGTSRQNWQPDQSRLRTSGAPSAATREARGWSGGGTQAGAGARPSTGNVGTRPSTGTGGARPSTGNAGARPSTGQSSYNRPSSSGSYNRPASSSGGGRPASSSYNRPSSGSSRSAFGGMNSGASTRSASSRGASSRGGGGYSGGGRGGGGRGGGGRR